MPGFPDLIGVGMRLDYIIRVHDDHINQFFRNGRVLHQCIQRRDIVLKKRNPGGAGKNIQVHLSDLQGLIPVLFLLAIQNNIIQDKTGEQNNEYGPRGKLKPDRNAGCRNPVDKTPALFLNKLPDIVR